MEKPGKNKAEAKPEATKNDVAATARSEMLEHARSKIGEAEDDEILEGIAEGRKMLAALEAEAAKRGIAGMIAGQRRPDASKGQVDGQFVCNRGMEGDRTYSKGDPREGKVSELAHLVRSGALSPADDETAEAVSAFLGTDVAVAAPAVQAEAED